MVTQTCNPSSQEPETEDREFKASLNYTERPSQEGVGRESMRKKMKSSVSRDPFNSELCDL